MMQIKSLFFFKHCFLCLGSIVLILICSGAGVLRCSQCGRKIRNGASYLRSENKIFCSEKCFIRILPECTICGKRSRNGGIYAADHSFFACPDCKDLPRCFACQIPTRGPKLADGRPVCSACMAASIKDYERALQLFQKVRSFLRSDMQLTTNHQIRFKLVGQQQLHQCSINSDSGSEQGLFHYDARIREVTRRKGFKTSKKIYKKETFEIFVLDYLPQNRMESVMAHELAHDWMTAYYPGIKEQWIKEGFAQYISWLYNRKKGQNRLNIAIEVSTDPVYGDGFRKIRSIAEKQQWEGLKRFLKSKQQRIEYINE